MTVENQPVSFGYKMSWLAFRSEDTDGVAATINLLNPSLTNWETGIDAAYASGKVYVSPPVKGWVFAVGNPCSSLDDDTNKNIEKLKNWLRALSSQFGEVQAFATHRVTEYHHWALARNGSIIRSYAYCGESGEVLDDDGAKTSDEPVFNLEGVDDFCAPDEDTVMIMAGAWGVNPQSLDDEPISSRLGLLGSITVREAASQPPVKKKGFRLPWFR